MSDDLSVCMYLFISLFTYFVIYCIYCFIYLHATASQVSWNITVYSITSSSATVRWLDFPLSLNVTHYLVRYKEPNGVSILFRTSRHSNTHYTYRLKAYTSYDVQVFAFTTSIDGNITYSSQTVPIKTPEGGKAPPSSTTIYWVYIQILLNRMV